MITNQGHHIRAMLTIARFYAQKDSVRILQGGTGFVCNEKDTIWIPNIPHGLEERFIDAILGGTLHESRHLFETDWEEVKESQKDPKYNLTNLLEDLRIEYNAINSYPGGRQILQRLNDYLGTKYKLRQEQAKEFKQNNPYEKLPKYLKIPPIYYLGMAMKDIALG